MADIKNCTTCQHPLTTENAEYVGEQELPNSPKYANIGMALYNCPKCNSTVAHKYEKNLKKGTYMKDKLYEVQAALWLIKEVLKKAIKPGPTLDYGKINARANASVNPEAKAIADKASAISQQAAPTLSYAKENMKSPAPVSSYAGAAEKAKAVRAKLDAQANSTASDTLKAQPAKPSVKKMDEEDGDIESTSKDELDVKIKSKLKAEMDKRNFGEADATKHVIDRDKGEKVAKLPKPPKIPN